MSQTNQAGYKYNPNEMGEDEFLQRFVVRQEVFDEIFEALQSADYSVPNQHHIIVGQRGQGKTTILRKVGIELKKDKKLSKFLIPVQFSEEQYSMRGLCSLWETVAEHLEDYHEALFEGALEKVEIHEDDDNYEMKCFSYLEKQLKHHNRKLVLLIDNINILLESLKEQEQHHLREILLTSSSFIIVGGSTKMFEQQYEYAKPFYEFFNIIMLEGLSFAETIALLKILGNKEQTKKINKLIKNNPARIETLRRVTGGVPRTIVMLFNIFVEDNSNTFNDLMKVLDDVTPLYQERMNHIPKVLQNITHAIAMNWDGMLTKEIAQKTKLESKVVSAQLKQLEKYHIIESESLGKNKIYSIKERFFNIWYLMRFGKKRDRHRVEWLIRFLLAWYNKDELEQKAKRFMTTCKKNNYHPEHALQYTEALSYAGIGDDLEHELKRSTKNYLSDMGSSLKNDLSETNRELYQKVLKHYQDNNIKKAIEVLEESGKETSIIFYLFAYLYNKQKEYKKAKTYYLKAIDSGNTDALFNLGALYQEQKEYAKAESYYLKAIENGDSSPFNNLGVLYLELKGYEKAEAYFLKAIESGSTDTFINLGNLYQEQKEYEKAETYYLKAIESGNTKALNNLGNVYQEQKEYKKAETYFLKSIESGNTKTLNNLGALYQEQKEYEKAETYYLKAIESGNTDAFYNLGALYQEQKEYKKTETYYLKSVESGSTDALNNLGALYQEQKEYAKAESYYLKAIESGGTDTLFNLGNLYKEQKEHKKAEMYYLEAIKRGDTEALYNLGALYQEQKEHKKAETYYLKSIESGSTDAFYNLGNLYQKQKEHKKAETYYLKSIGNEDTEALNNLGVLYQEQKKYEKAKTYYLKSIESGNTDALNNLGILYQEQKEYEKAEAYFLKAIKSGDKNAANPLAWHYFEQAKKKKSALNLIQQNYNDMPKYHNTYILSVIELWVENFSASYDKFLEWIKYEDAVSIEYDVSIYLNLLIAKGQAYKAKEFMELPKYQLKERYKPIWYALMSLMQDDFPHEIKKMGSELKGTVDEVLEEIEKLKVKYAL